jgi:hypothetical protein
MSTPHRAGPAEGRPLKTLLRALDVVDEEATARGLDAATLAGLLDVAIGQPICAGAAAGAVVRGWGRPLPATPT